MSRITRVRCITMLFLAAVAVLAAAPAVFAATTMTLPDYSKTLLTPASQATTSYTNVVPNALASYFTYVPYTTADAVALGFPSTCGNLAKGDAASTEDCYTITARKFQQRLALPGIFGGGQGLLDPSGIPYGNVTQVYGYGSGGVGWTPPGTTAVVTGNAPAPFVDGTLGTTGIWHFPAPTIRGTKGRPIRIQWLNELPNEMPSGFDPTVDGGPNAPDNYPYNRIVTHVHGAHVTDDSDGYAAAWFTPNFALTGPGWAPSTHGPEGTYLYPMDQEASTIWYHDHAMGLTHNNTQMGLAGFFPITDANEQALITANILPTGNYDLGFALQDRMFDVNGQFAMPDYPVFDLNSPGCTLTVDGLPDPLTCTRLDWMKDVDGHLIPYVPGSPLLSNPNNIGAPFPAASTTLEYFGNIPVVNGVTYGKYDVEPRVYRMRFIGGTDSRTWIMKLVSRETGSVIPFWQIASEQGFLNNPVSRDTMDLLPGERLDVLVDLTGIPAGTKIVMQNLGPDTPYGGPNAGDPPSVDIPEIMEFLVTSLTGSDNILTPSTGTNLRPVSGAIVPLVPTPGTPVRNVSLVEGVDQYGRTTPTIDGRGFMPTGVPSTEVIRLNDTEEWNIINDTVDAHPIHLHLVAFQVISRQTYTGFVPAVTDTIGGIFTQPSYSATGFVTTATSNPQGVEAWEAGWKDTIDCPPATVTTVRAKFDIAGSKYVWHCHILSHEEHDMMRPLVVAAPVTVNFNAGTGGSIEGTLVQSVSYLASTSTVTAVPGAGYLFLNWTGTGGFVTTTANPLTVSGVTAGMNITANFIPDSYAVNFIAGTGGSISGTLNQTVPYLGSSTTVTAVPDPGNTFVNWTGTGGFVPTTANPLVVSNVSAAMNITANFSVTLATMPTVTYTDYFTTPNWANSPPLRKFVDTLPGLGAGSANNLGQYMPVAQADQYSYPGEDYYEIGLKDYSVQMHSDMPATKLRGYYQINTGMTTTGVAVPTDHASQYLGPLIVATKDRPVRIKFVNNLATGPAGNLFVPVDTTLMGSGPYEINFDPATMASRPTVSGNFTENRATLHLHGGRTPWISDGTPHQWITPAGENPDYPKGVSVAYVPDMWYDAAGQHINETTYPGSNCAGNTTCSVPGAQNDPGPGAQTFYWTNQQSGRLMFYHDHAWGITRLNVYVGEAAGYLIQDATEARLIADGIIPADQIPLVIQDKTFVDPATIVTTDPTWKWGSIPGSAVKGDLWWPHVYMPAQNPYNPNMSGINDMGRWHYGPWFFPPTPVCGSSPLAVKPMCIEHGAVTNELFALDPNCSPVVTDLCTTPPERPGTPNPSWGAEAFLDTMIVNGTAYPKMTVEPKPYRMRILNAAHDRFLNLQFYKADPTQVNPACPTCATNTEVRMVPAAPTAGFPAMWPTDGREGGVPDPTMVGPEFIQIGTEGGFLPQPSVLPNQPTTWNTDPTMFNVGNVLQQRDGGGTLILGPAERADVIVDFSAYAGQTLILYNDAPTAFPALDPHYDYYTGAPDRTDIGGYTAIPVGLGPNVRTVMQIIVSGPTGSAFNLAALQAAFVTTPTNTGVFKENQHDIIVGQNAYNTTYNMQFPFTWPYWGLSRISDAYLSFMQTDGTLVNNKPVLTKAIHDEMGGTFDEYGRMSAKLGLEAPFTNAAIANFILQNYVDPPTEIVKNGDYQIWKITHNGVDTHPIHFHLFEVQLLNRVGWDGFIRVPDDNELGWKDTLRIAPLEDTIVALRPVQPIVPFALPDSIRPLNPQRPIGVGDTMGFSDIDPTTGNRYAVPMTNELYNFGWEYVWHCHILSHEENDMMRSIVFQVAPDAPTNLIATGTGPTSVAWMDNAKSEYGFELQLATEPTFTIVSTVTTTVGPSVPMKAFDVPIVYSDPTTTAGPSYYYRVRAYSPNGVSAWSNVAIVNPAPIGVVNPVALAFGKQELTTTSAAQTVTLSNIGVGDLLVSGISFTGANVADFSLTGGGTCGFPLTLAAGANCSITVAFAPAAIGPRSATILLDSNSSFNPTITIGLSGTGALDPIAGVAPTSLSFSNQMLNVITTAQTVTLSNTGTGPLTINSITASGDFAQTNGCGGSLAAGASCSINVTFTPTVFGARTGSVTISSNDPVNPTLTVTLSGNGTVPMVAGVSPTSLNFGNILVSTTSATAVVTLSNPGALPLTISSITVPASDFAITGNTCGATLPAGNNCIVSVRFSPTFMGTQAATLAIVSNDPVNSYISVPLNGTGIQPVATVVPAVLDFGMQILRSTSTAQLVTVLNTGTSPMVINSITFGGVNPGQFSRTTTCVSPLAAGASCSVTVTFVPNSAGSKTATLNVNLAAPALSQSVALSGTGTVVVLTPLSLTYASQAYGTTSAAQNVNLYNAGLGPLTISGITIGGANPADFIISNNNCGNGLAAGSTCRVGVQFSPKGTGTRTATLTFADNDPTSPQTVVLSGTSVAAPVNSVSPPSLAFSSTLNTTTAAQAVTVTNTGNAAMTINSFGLGGTNPGQFQTPSSTCGTFPATLASGASCTVNVTFRPTALTPNPMTAILNVNVASPAVRQSVSLTGTVLAPVLNVAPPSLAFSSTLNTTTAAQAVTVSNTGTATMTINSITLGGTNPGQFARTTTCAATLASGASCTVNVTFRPTALTPNPMTAILNVNVAGPATSQTVSLTGTVLAPVLNVAPPSLAFSSTLNTTTAAQSVTVSNTGTAPMTINSFGLVGANPGQFQTPTSTCGAFPATLASGASCTVNVTFRPTALTPNPMTASLNVNVAAPAASTSVPLTGTVLVPVLNLAPTLLSFGTQTVFTTSTAQVVTVSNTGTAPMTINSVTFGGTNPGQFARTTTCGAFPATVAAGANCTVSVTFAPTSAGSKTATLNVNVAGPAISGTVPVSGTGQ